MDTDQIKETEVQLICHLVYSINDMLVDVPNILRRISELDELERMFYNFECITRDLQDEMLGIKAWCSNLRLLDRNDIAADSFTMSPKTAEDCGELLCAVWYLTDKADEALKDVERMSRPPTRAPMLVRVQDFPKQAEGIMTVHTMLEGVVIGLSSLNTHIDQKPTTPVIPTSTISGGLEFHTNDQPFKMMWDTAVEGLRLLTREHQTEEWSNLLDELFGWGCGRFQHPFPLDLYFDYAVLGQSCRKTLRNGFFYILYFIGRSSIKLSMLQRHADSIIVALKAIRVDSKLADSIKKARSQLADVLKKDVFLVRTMSEWCDEIMTLEKPIGWLSDFAEDFFDTSPIGSIKFGMKSVYEAQETIDWDFSSVWRDNPELERTREKRATCGVAPRRQALIDHGIVERPETVVLEQPSWRGLTAQQTRVFETGNQGGPSKLGVSPDTQTRPVENSTTRSESPVTFEDVAHVNSEMDNSSDRHELDNSTGSVGASDTSAGD